MSVFACHHWDKRISDENRNLQYTLLSVSDTLISSTRLKLAKNQAKAKQNPETELFENYSFSSSTLSSRNNMRYSNKLHQKTSAVLNRVA